MTETNEASNDCRDGRLKAQSAAVELYQLAALLVGDERQAAELVEAAVARTEADPCADAEASVKTAQFALVEAAVSSLQRADGAAFDPPSHSPGIGGCIEAEEVSGGRLDSGPQVLREGLDKLSAAQRVIFVLRAVLGWDAAASAALLGRAAGRAWEPVQISEVFRQALCSVSTSLVSAAANA